ncbi:helix-turn-helix domain-containing protein [Flavobacterium muglaense]|uniref:Helix-turn-helix domain-containing protein n=1 Tax=Flavobacterium muglaense TaxID=2764716 RepID=A0A923SGK8_9FLAO|nr:helix-turn-helix domain-containing protein [Flavobacterium muglaense]MBC5839301.1 helix-turn-helix domain-containing protein [Flavobacterium muglaense]MBC5845801.1 helix-turn-helix domain-containing protein [Flavobacterium muglaense]
MSHPFQENLLKIEKRLDELTSLVSKKQERIFDKVIIDNDEFQRLFKISPGTAANWREKGLIAYSQINNKIVYKIEDINKMLDDNYRPFKK